MSIAQAGDIGPGRKSAALIAQLHDPDPTVRIAAIRKLAETRDRKAVQPLIEILAQDPDSRVRGTVAYSLGRFKDPRAIEPLIASLKDEHVEVCVNSIFALVQMQTSSQERIEAFTAALGHPQIRVCRAAAVGLVMLGDKRAVTPLIRALKNERETVRSGAAFALGYLGDQRALPPLLNTLKDPDEDVRNMVIASLGLLADRRAIPALEQIAARDPDPNVRSRAAEVVKKLKQARSR